MVKRIKKQNTTTVSETEALQQQTSPLQVQIDTNSPPLTSPDEVAPSTPPKIVRKQTNPRPKKQKSVVLEQQIDITPLNLLPVFDQIQQNEEQKDDLTTNQLQNEEQVVVQKDDEVMHQEESFASEIEHMTNEQQKQLALNARSALKRDILDQARNIVYSHLNDIPEDLKKNVSDIVLRCYDDPASLFQALKHSNRGQLRMKFKNLPRPSLLAETSTKVKKLEGFRQFLQNRISRQ